MLIISCPHCGPRDEIEFSCGGEAHIARPLANNKITDDEFADYLFIRDNPKGIFLERWRHSAGCRKWFNVARDTVTHEIIEVYPMGRLPKKPTAKNTYTSSWRRGTAAEKAAKPEKRSKSGGAK
jgi:heterotetrameric sarcosine oxidase delta subunit